MSVRTRRHFLYFGTVEGCYWILRRPIKALTQNSVTPGTQHFISSPLSPFAIAIFVEDLILIKELLDDI